MLQPLKNYDMSAERGFLCQYDASAVILEDGWRDASSIARELPNFLPTGNVRKLLEQHLPAAETLTTVNELANAELRALFVSYSFMVQAYIWGETQSVDYLPESIAIPMVALADKLEQQPLLTYSSYVLDNWAKIDSNAPIDLDNIFMIQNFLGGLDEAWFVLVHVAIEATAGEILERMQAIIQAAENEEDDAVSALLNDCAASWMKINKIFDRMIERCDPYIYFERVRPYIHGWADNPALPNGVIYKGVLRYGSAGQAFRGQTGSQSSIVPSMDALLGIGHAADPLKAYLDQLHAYRPVGHRRFIDDVRASSKLRQFVSNHGSPNLRDAYNSNVQAVADFRTRHLEYAASYINKQGRKSAGNDTEIGTGGTPFMRYLKKHRDETAANLL